MLAMIVNITPSTLTNIAELIAAFTHHMIAAISFLNKNMAVGTPLPILETLFKISVAITVMARQEAFLTELEQAFGTFVLTLCKIYDALTLLTGT